MYQVTKAHTAGIMEGTTTSEITTVAFQVGQMVDKAIGGGAYEVVKVVELESVKHGRMPYLCSIEVGEGIYCTSKAAWVLENHAIVCEANCFAFKA